MAAAADISFDDYISERTIDGIKYPPYLYSVGNTPPYRVEHTIGGRSDVYGHFEGVMPRGRGYWRGVVEFHRRFVKSSNYPGIGYVRAAIAELAESVRTFKVPMDTQYGKGLVRFKLRSTGAEIPAGAVVGTLTTAANSRFSALRNAGGATVDVELLPGAFFTIDNELYMASATAGVQTVTSASVRSIPKFPTATGMSIELDKPFIVGRIPPGEIVTPAETQDSSGGWVLPWEQAED